MRASQSFFYAALLIVFLSGCVDDGGEPTGPGHQTNTMTAVLGGVSWSADIMASAMRSPDSPVLGITGTGTYGQSSCNVIITLANPSVGVFQLGGSSNYDNFGRIYPPGDTIGYTTLDGRANGSVQVESITADRITGRFSFTAYKSQGQSIDVTQGEFDLRITLIDKGGCAGEETAGYPR